MPYKKLDLIVSPGEYNPPLVGPYNPEYIPPGETKAPWAIPKAEDLLAIPGVSPGMPVLKAQQEQSWQAIVDESDWGDEFNNIDNEIGLLDLRSDELQAALEELYSSIPAPGDLSDTIVGFQEALIDEPMSALGSVMPYAYRKITGLFADPIGLELIGKIQALEHELTVELPARQIVLGIHKQVYLYGAGLIQASAEAAAEMQRRGKPFDNPFDTVDEVMAIIKNVDKLSPADLREIEAMVQGIIDYYAPGGTGATGQDLIDAAGTELPGGVVLPPLEAPEQPTPSRPVSLHQLTTQEILDSMAFMPPPDTTFTQAEWETYLQEELLYSDEDIENQYQLYVDQLVANWEEDIETLNSYREGTAEMPKYSWTDWLQTMVSIPTLAGLDMVGKYFQYVGQPITGLVFGSAFKADWQREYWWGAVGQRLPISRDQYDNAFDHMQGMSRDITAKTQEFAGPTPSFIDYWLAAGKAWEDWDAPFEGTPEWVLKYMIMEGMCDPLTYVGWGLATKVTRPLGAFGKYVATAERGLMVPGDIFADVVKGGLGHIKLAAGQRYIVYAAGALNNQNQVYAKFFNSKAWTRLTKTEMLKASRKSILEFLKNPMNPSRTTRYGADLLMHDALNESDVARWLTNSFKSEMTPAELTEFITKGRLETLQDIYVTYFLHQSPRKEFLLGDRTVELMLNALGVRANDANRQVMLNLLSARTKKIIAGATSFIDDSANAMDASKLWSDKLYRHQSNNEKSLVALARKDKSPWVDKLTQVPLRLQGLWVDKIDKHLVRVFAEAYLTFGLYGPYNMMEDVFRSFFGGVSPHRLGVDEFIYSWGDLTTDPNLWLHGATSEMRGYMAKTGLEEGWHNYILQLGPEGYEMFGRGGEKVYSTLVRKPGEVSQAFRRNFVDKKAFQILVDEGGDLVRALRDAVGPMPKFVDAETGRLVRELLDRAVISGIPARVSDIKNIVTLSKIKRKKLFEIISAHDEIPAEGRVYIMKQHAAGVLDSVDGIIKTMDEVRHMAVDRVIKSPQIAIDQYQSLTTKLMEFGLDNTYELAQAYIALKHMTDGITMAAANSHRATTISTRGLTAEGRSKAMQATDDEIIKLVDQAGANIQQVSARLRAAIDTLPGTTQSAERFAVTPINKARFHGTDSPEDIGSIIGEGLRPGSSMSSEAGQAAEHGIILKYGKVGGEEAVSYRPGDFIAREGAQKPEAIYIKPEHWAQPVREDIDAIRRELSEELGKLEAQGITPEQFGAMGKWERFRASKKASNLFDELEDASEGRFFGGYQQIIDEVTAVSGDIPVYTVTTDFATGGEGKMLWEKAELISGITGPADISSAYRSASKNYLDTLDLMVARGKQYVTDLHEFRSTTFAAKPRKVENSWWEQYNREVGDIHRVYQNDISGYRGDLDNLMQETDSIARPTAPRAPIKVENRQLAPQDVANLLGVGVDDISDGLMRIMILQDKNEFVNYIMRRVKAADVGFTPESVGAVYDQIVRSLDVSDKTLDWMTMMSKAIKDAEGEIHLLRAPIDESDIATVAKLADDVAGRMEKVMYDEAPVVSKVTLKPAASDYRDMPNYNIEVEGRVVGKLETGEFLTDSPTLSVGRIDMLEDNVMSKSFMQDLDIAINQVAREKGFGTIDILGYTKHKNIYKSAGYKPGVQRSEGSQVFTKTVGAPPTQRVSKPGFGQSYQDLRQTSMDKALKQYWKEFPDYTHQNAFDATMKTIYPFWTYESQRWIYLPKTFMQKPGLGTEFMRYQDHSDKGYLPLFGDVQWNPLRGTVFGTPSTRLFKKDYPEYYDRFGGAIGKGLEINDWLSRFGFYPGVHVALPIALVGGLSPQTGEILPSIVNTPLGFLMAAFPESEAVKTITELIFPSRYRDYLIGMQIMAAGHDGDFIMSKLREGEELTEEENAAYTEARRRVGIYGGIAEQFGIFRMRPEEMGPLYEASTKVISDYTGFTPDQLQWMQRHNYDVWAQVGGMPPSVQIVLEEMGAYQFAGVTTPLLPGRWQSIYDKNTLDWKDIEIYSDSYKEDKLGFDAELLSGVIGGRAWQDLMYGVKQDMVKYIEEKEKKNPVLTWEGRLAFFEETGQKIPTLHPMNELRNLLFSLELERIPDPETGEMVYDWDKFFAHQQYLRDAVPEHLKPEWDAMIQKNMSDTEIIHRGVYDTYFRKYYEVKDETIEQFPEEEQLMIRNFLSWERRGINIEDRLQIQAYQSQLTGLSLISSFRSNLGDNRKALRYKNPHLDAWLYYWGKSGSFLTDEAKAIYPTIAMQTGRSIIK